MVYLSPRLWIQISNTHLPSARRAHIPISARFTRRWWGKSWFTDYQDECVSLGTIVLRDTAYCVRPPLVSQLLMLAVRDDAGIPESISSKRRCLGSTPKSSTTRI